MKKLFSVMAIVALVSCNSGTEEATPAADTTAVVAPAPEVTPAVVDTAAVMVKDTAAVVK